MTTDHTREAIEQITLAHLPVAENPFITCICGDKWMTVTEHAKHIARHVAAVVADKDAEIERLHETVAWWEGTCEGWHEQVGERDRIVGLLRIERDAAVARLGAIAALVDERAAQGVDVYHKAAEAMGKIAAILGDSADATTKRGQEIRAAALREAADEIDRSPLTVGLAVAGRVSAWLRARADALTDGW